MHLTSNYMTANFPYLDQALH